MKLKQGTIVRAYKALDKIMQQNTTLPISKKAFDMQRKMQPAWDFQVNEERKIAERHPDVNPANMCIQVPDSDSEEEKARKIKELDSFEKEMLALCDMETDLEFEPFTISISRESIKMAGNDIKALMGFVEFEE